MNETRRKPTTGRQFPSLFDKWHGIFYLPSHTDTAGHTKVFDYPVTQTRLDIPRPLITQSWGTGGKTTMKMSCIKVDCALFFNLLNIHSLRLLLGFNDSLCWFWTHSSTLVHFIETSLNSYLRVRGRGSSVS